MLVRGRRIVRRRATTEGAGGNFRHAFLEARRVSKMAVVAALNNPPVSIDDYRVRSEFLAVRYRACKAVQLQKNPAVAMLSA